MSVHKEISAHSSKQADRILGYKKLDAQREIYIAEAIEKCSKGEEFQVTQINRATEELNLYARKNNLPERVYVTIEMVNEFCNKAD